MHRIRERRFEPFGDQRIQLPQKCRERLAGARRRENEGVLTLGDRRPSFLLRRAGRAQGLTKPFADQRMEAAKRGGQAPSVIGWEVVTRKLPPAGRHASYFRDAAAAAVPAAAPAAAPITVDLVSLPMI